MNRFFIFISLLSVLWSCQSSESTIKTAVAGSNKIVVASINDIVFSSLDIKTKTYERWRLSQISTKKIIFTQEQYNEKNNIVQKRTSKSFSIQQKEITLGSSLLSIEKIENKKIWYRLTTKP